MHQISMHSPVGDLTIYAYDDCIDAVEWGWCPDQHGCELLREAKRQLDAYFDGESEVFDLPLGPAVTPFDQRMRTAMLGIPYGTTKTYGDIAGELRSAARAVGMGCGRNRLPIIVPCHRVLPRSGGLGGYSGGMGQETKRQLLILEGCLPPPRLPD